MPRAILYLSSQPDPDRPAAPGPGAPGPDGAAELDWPDQDRLQRILAVDEFVSARSFAPLGTEGPYLAIYEIDTDDVQALQARLAEVGGAGTAPGRRAGSPPASSRRREMTLYAL
ncbi:hypothetical protein ACQP1W_45605 [Spirillospora sp. CA-255316]